jgi:uncharacterized protein DUF4231
MTLPQSLKLDLKNHWMNDLTGPDGQALPAFVIEKWTYFARQSRRSRNGYFILEGLGLVGAAAIPVCAALGATDGVPAVLGAMVVVLGGLRQLFGFHEEWISSSQARYTIEREIALFAVGNGTYRGAAAVRNLVIAVEEIASSEGVNFVHRRKRASDLLAMTHEQRPGE